MNVAPSPFPPPPRRVLGGAGASAWVARLLTIPHALIGLALLAGIFFPIFVPDAVGKEGLWVLSIPIGVFALFWNLGVWLVARSVWLEPLRLRALYVRGERAAGRVLSRRRLERKPWFHVVVEFIDGAGARHEVDLQVQPESWFDEVAEGAAVTVLYDAREPTRAVAYEFGRYTVAG